MTHLRSTKALNTGKVVSASRCAATWRVLLLTLMAMIGLEVNAAGRSAWLNGAEPETSEELERYVDRFDSFHSVVQAFLDTCKTNVSIYQTMRVGGDHLPAAALADGAYNDILQCVEESRDGVSDRYRDLPELSPDADAMVGPAVRSYLSTVHQVLDVLTPLEENGVRESIDDYDRRYAWMLRDLETATNEVRAAAAWTD